MPGFCVFGQMLQGNPSSGEEGFDILTSRPIAKCGTVGANFCRSALTCLRKTTKFGIVTKLGYGENFNGSTTPQPNGVRP